MERMSRGRVDCLVAPGRYRPRGAHDLFMFRVLRGVPPSARVRRGRAERALGRPKTRASHSREGSRQARANMSDTGRDLRTGASCRGASACTRQYCVGPVRGCAGPGRVVRGDVDTALAIAGHFFFFGTKIEMEASKHSASQNIRAFPVRKDWFECSDLSCATRKGLLVAHVTASPYNTDDPAYCPFDKMIFFLFSFFVPDLACY